MALEFYGLFNQLTFELLLANHARILGSSLPLCFVLRLLCDDVVHLRSLWFIPSCLTKFYL